jgi:hypothetical protein
MENSTTNKSNIPSETSKKIIALIIKYGTLSLILEEGCNSVFRTDKCMINVSILNYFIENIKFILQNKDKDENIKYNSIKKFIDNFILYIDRKKRHPISHIKSQKTFCKYTTCERFIRNYSPDEFNKYKEKFIEVFNEYYLI